MFKSIYIYTNTTIVVLCIYSKAKSCIRKDNMISDYFMCNIGVRQGDNLSPVFFTLFINDFTEYVSTAYGGLNIAQSCYPSLINSEDMCITEIICITVC